MTRTILLSLCLLIGNTALAQWSKMSVEAVPVWVSATSINPNKPGLNGEDGYTYLSVEKQVSLAEQRIFYRERIRMLSAEGAVACNEISIDFMPAFQRVVFHSIGVIRNGRLIDKLDRDNFRVKRDESDLTEFIYNGTENAIASIDDLRKEDVLEYSYSIIGFNPVLASRYAGYFELRFSFPVHNLFYKLIVPRGREVVVKNYLSVLDPVIERKANETHYVWHDQNTLPVNKDAFTPGWYDPVPTIMISEYRNWNEVCKWAFPLYNFRISTDPLLVRQIKEIESRHTDGEGRILSALRLVQDDIRYFGIEVGENSHKPHLPDKTFARRFGDCKDKTYLLCLMLKKMGIRADPVLINTEYKKALINLLPSPIVFDHVVARVMLGNEIYFLDPTISYQRGRLRDIYFPDYQYGLVINEETRGLTAIPPQGNSMIMVKETFDVKDLKGHARLMVRTEYKGQAADNARSDFRANGRQEMLENFQEFYTDDFEEITGDSIRYFDNEETGVVTTYEYYTINDFWLDQRGSNRKFAPYLIRSILTRPDDIGRNMPYTLKYPLVNTEEIEINLPQDWAPGEKKGNISCEGFRFDYTYKISGRKVLLKYKYHHLKDHVLPSEMKAYDKAYAAMMKEFGDPLPSKGETALVESATEIQPATQPVEEKNPFGPYGYLYGLLFIAVVVTLLVRRKRTM